MEVATQSRTRRRKSNTKPPSESNLQDLPANLIMDILSRLPMKTLLSCRCVSKLWQTLLSDPHFTHLYLSRAPISLLLRTFHKQQKPNWLHLFDLRDANTNSSPSRLKLHYNTRLPNTEFELVNSSNGLLCLCKKNNDFFHHKDPIFVCNPILAEFVTLPQVSEGRRVGIVAFGFSSRTNEYKVLRIVCELRINAITRKYEGDGDYEAEIYVLGSGSWRSIGKPRFSIYIFPHFNTYVNGAIHWHAIVDNVSDFIHAFDFETEEFRVVPEPPTFEQLYRRYGMCIGVLKGCLSICDYSGMRDVKSIDLWLMKEYGVKESWTKLYVINNLILEMAPVVFCDPIMILDSGEILMMLNWDSLVSYDPKEKVFNFLKIFGVALKFKAIGYTPSFVSLRHLANKECVKLCSA